MKKSKRPRAGYLPGVGWRDVLKGRPVTAAERRSRKDKGPPQVVVLRCRDCPHTCRMKKRPGLFDRTHRCEVCGGVMDPVT